MAITDTYLKNPDQFPDHSAGTAWGPHAVYIDFVGGPYRVSGLNRDQAKQLKDSFPDESPGHNVDGQQVSEIHVLKADPKLFVVDKPYPITQGFDLDHCSRQLRLSGEEMCGLIELGDNIAGYLWTTARNKHFENSVFENYLRVLVTYRLLQMGGMLLHSAGIVSDGSAFLFPGQSGSGKSTLSRMSLELGRTVLSDDMNALVWHDGRPFLEKVPFTGDLGRTPGRSRRYPLRGIVALNKCDTVSLQPLAKSHALALLVANAPFLNADPHRLPELLDRLSELTLQVPTHTMNFNLDDDPWNELDNI